MPATSAGGGFLLTARLLAAARALAGVSLADLAQAAGLPLSRLRRLGTGAQASDAETLALTRALEELGVLLLPEGNGKGAGVRLKFTRLDARQIGRLENEGGPPGEDDLP